jgi:hypothetical protein
LLSTLELDGVLIQADALHISPAFLTRRRAGRRPALVGQNNQRRLHQQIVTQFPGNQHFPVVISDFEASLGRLVR